MESIIVDDNVSKMEDVAGLITILASLTDVTMRQKGDKLSYRYMLPSNIIYMAENRSLRHALDKGTPDVLGGDCHSGQTWHQYLHYSFA